MGPPRELSVSSWAALFLLNVSAKWLLGASSEGIFIKSDVGALNLKIGLFDPKIRFRGVSNPKFS
jgi:hypothetical protein